MLSIFYRMFVVSGLTMMALPSIAQHSHGKGLLQLSLNGDLLQGQWTMPMEALLGFEQLPKNPKQTEAMNELQKSLQNASYFIELPAEAKCQQLRSKPIQTCFKGLKAKPTAIFSTPLSSNVPIPKH